MTWRSNIPGLGRIEPATTAPVTPPSGPDPIQPPRVVVALATTGAPTSDQWNTGQAVIDAAGVTWTCTAGGQPGTWQRATASAGVNTYNGQAGNVTGVTHGATPGQPTTGTYFA